MQIAPTTIAVATALPLEANETYDIVSPTRLFDLAATRFEAALATSRIGAPTAAPSAIVAVMALQQAEHGLRSLKSINVPTASFDVRHRASRAIAFAEQGIELLRGYHAAVTVLGDGAHDLDLLPASTIALLDGGRSELRNAIAVARRA